MFKLFRALLLMAIGFGLGLVYAKLMAAKQAQTAPAQTATQTAARQQGQPARPAAQGGSIRLIDFNAEWCAPCKTQDPIIENLAVAYSGRVTVTKVDIDKHPQIAERYGIQGVPTLVIERNGREARRFVGLQHEKILAAALEDALR